MPTREQFVKRMKTDTELFGGNPRNEMSVQGSRKSKNQSDFNHSGERLGVIEFDHKKNELTTKK